MMGWKCPSSILLALGVAVVSAFAAPREVAATVVVFNSADETSRALAEYYASRRGIDSARLVGLACPGTEEISRDEYEAAIAKPLCEIFVRNGWWKLANGRVTSTSVRFVALMRGMPLKIRPQEGLSSRENQPEAIRSRNEASVDSELAVLGLQEPVPSGIIVNPLFRRFSGIMDSPVEPWLLLVCRLDAPTEGAVRSMIDGALAAEREGLWGWGYVDSRNIKSGGYAEGDRWLEALAVEMRRKGVPTLWDKAPQLLPSGYPVTDAACYYGWYTQTIEGPFADPGFGFRPGAVAVHLHSYSAITLRDANAGWCGPLVERGAAATLGNVYEPYLTLTAHLDVFQGRLMAGFTFAESAYMAARGLSWMNVAVGDPLYRPYAAWYDLQRNAGSSDWERYRQIVRMADGEVVAAARELRVAAQQTGNSMFLEALAAAQADSTDLKGALETTDAALAMDNKPLIAFRLGLERMGLLLSLERRFEAVEWVWAAQKKFKAPEQKKLLEALAEHLSAGQLDQ